MNFQIIFIFAVLHGITQAKLVNLSCKQIRAFVDGHNLRRLKLAKGQIPGQPPASGMKFMVWDNELAAKAAKLASREIFQHNPDRTIGSGRFSTGENIYVEGSTKRDFKINIDNALKSWFDEHMYYTYGTSTKRRYSQYPIGHYTQMAWANTMYLGCAISQYKNGGMNEFFVVCNYGPGGNYADQNPYERGTGSSSLICGKYDCSKPYGDKCIFKRIIKS